MTSLPKIPYSALPRPRLCKISLKYSIYIYIYIYIYRERERERERELDLLYIHVTCVVIDFFLNNQQDAKIIQIYSVIKLYMCRASSLPIIRSFLLYIRHWQVSCRFLSQDVISWLWLEAVIKNLHETYQCRMYSRKLLMMGTEDARNL